MHPMEASSLADAQVEAQRLMQQHAGVAGARIFLNAAEVEVIEAISVR